MATIARLFAALLTNIDSFQFFLPLFSIIFNDFCSSYQFSIFFTSLQLFSRFPLFVESSQWLLSPSTSLQFFSAPLTSVQFFRILLSSVELISSAIFLKYTRPLRWFLVTLSTCVCPISRQLVVNHFRSSSNRILASKGKNWNRFQKILYKENHQSRSEENLAAKAPSDPNAATPIRFMTLNCKRQENYARSRSSDRNLYRTILEHSLKIIWKKKHKRLNGEELAAKAALQPWCGHSNTITNSQLQTFVLWCTQPQQRGTLTQSLHCDLLTLKCKTN